MGSVTEDQPKSPEKETGMEFEKQQEPVAQVPRRQFIRPSSPELGPKCDQCGGSGSCGCNAVVPVPEPNLSN